LPIPLPRSLAAFGLTRREIEVLDPIVDGRINA
jgi:hypothetical protein